MTGPLSKHHDSAAAPLNAIPAAKLAGIYLDRVCSPAETVARLEPHFDALGITRVARQTGLDNIGIPCFAAFRPNARSLAVNQGKGLDDDAAKASAVMEAAEFALAEIAEIPVVSASAHALEEQLVAVMDTRRLFPMNAPLGEHDNIDWVEGRNLFSHEPVLVPHAAVRIDATLPATLDIVRSTNGLASGNTEQEAVFHGLCELIERDATTLFFLRSGDFLEQARVAPESFSDPMVDCLTAKIAGVDCALTLFNMTSDIGVPVFMAAISAPPHEQYRHFHIAAGYGCHPVASRAALRAITEAAQTRITNIAGTRDDFEPEEYKLDLRDDLKALISSPDIRGEVPPGCVPFAPLSSLLSFVEQRLWGRDIRDITVVQLGGGRYGISVVKLIAPSLEDRACNPHWRPGERAVSQLMAGS